MSGVVVREGLLEADQFPRRTAIIGCGGGILRGPFEQDRIVRVVAAARLEVGRHRGVRRVDEGVELAKTAGPALVELRMEREALEAAFGSGLNAHFPVRRGQIEIRRHGFAIVADAYSLPVMSLAKKRCVPGSFTIVMMRGQRR